MKLACTLCGLFVAVAVVNAGPVKRQAVDDLNPLNEVYVVEADGDAATDNERGDRDKRKIGIIKLGATNGIINFVFGKLDSFLDAKTNALAALEEGNKAKNAAFGIDNTQSATSQFISNLISQKIQAGTASIGPLISGATSFISTASSGIGNAVASKIAPLSSLSGGLSGGSSDGSAGGGLLGGLSGGLGGILSSKIQTISSLSSGSGGLGGLLGGLSGGSGDTGGSAGGSTDFGTGSSSGEASAGAGLSLGGSTGGGVNLGAFANLNGGTIATTTEDIPEFDRVHVSLDVPPPVFGNGFTLITNVSKVLSSVITNSARRTQNVLEVFKPFFRGAFAIKGLPSDNPK
ncbi:keratin, type II cytoskeletal 2 epidermal-like [Neodiprion fabricii]|uniref:keratin, type II cytoskeletal 2 epidermal-like n=1 Tax=Neodiprion fabricii TaxID=2872261 RepID=UPI001ED96AEA|nr:keratin, type II cytoskeletal 2 epidermal-like [Neodiprion fabricii]